ncbi:MAG: DNA primase [Chloroflexi bacterium]|nr:DNA primase [Chloroflexota bacterium]
MSVVDEVKMRLDIVDVVSAYVPSLKKAGKTYKANCPFHSEKTPSFVVNPERGTWHCFGACSTGGDMFTFVQRIENVDFPEALRILAQRAGVELTPRSAAVREEEEEKVRLRSLLSAAAEYYHTLLLRNSMAGQARDYLQKRGITANSVERFYLGYAPDSWDQTSKFLLDKGCSIRDLVAVGLVIERDDKSGTYDRFRGRLMFPIRDINGQTVGFGGRVLDQGVPKYLNSPQTSLFDKSHLLYALDLAREQIRRAETAVIVEGYVDALVAHQYDFANVVASLGTALTEEQVQLVKRFAKRVVLALDADKAGDAATWRGLEVIRDVVDEKVIPIPTWRGLVRYQGRSALDIRVARLPEDKDPDEVIRENRTAWDELIRDAQPIADFALETLIRDLDLNKGKDKATAVRRVLPLLADIVDPIERSHYIQRLAHLVRVDERVIESEFTRLGRKDGMRQVQGNKPMAGPDSEAPWFEPELEEHCLARLLAEPSSLDIVQRALGEIGTAGLNSGDFELAQNRSLFAEIPTGIFSLPEDPFRVHILDRLNTIRAQLEHEPRVTRLDQMRATIEVALRLRARNLSRQAEELRLLMEEASQEDDQEAASRLRVQLWEMLQEVDKVKRALLVLPGMRRLPGVVPS